ncbi:MAG: Co2+/Mg2+ efflux protein ApaG [Cyclobacteriaceae bacterium]|nr:Co2+/Mg2+ efflux protein ApaG [Cyclobacteriaceae bacterium]
MVTEITNGIKVSVKTEYQPGYSSPVQRHFVFTYKIIIENESNHTIKLISRHWDIHDITYNKQVVEGEGVVGQQPVLEPGQSHHYVSGCTLKSGFGKMHGFYTMEKLMDGQKFSVKIPVFSMVAPFKLN